jgi:hypothetical protein
MTATNRIAALALTILASATLLVGAVGPAQQANTAPVVRTIA